MKLKILMFGWEFPPFNSGGLGTACFGLTRALAGSDVDVTFVLPKKIAVNPKFVRIIFADISVVSGKDSKLFSGYITSEEYLWRRKEAEGFYGSTLLEEVRQYAQKAKSIAMNENFDIIHAHDWLSFLAGMEAKKISGKPLILHMHATEFDRTGGQGVNQNVYDIEKYAMEKADRIIAVSNFTKEKIVKHYSIDWGKIDVIHNGVDEVDFPKLPPRLEKIKKEGRQKVILYTGRITIQKGVEYFIQAAKKVLEYYPNALFVISGSGDMQYQMIEEAARLGVGDNVIFTGWLTSDDLNALYQAADLYVMPSVSEPFGIGPLEAIVNGAPVIISKQTGVSEVLTHALKVDFWDVDEMANKILYVLQNESLRKTLKEKSRKEIEKLTWENAANKVLNVYKKIFGKFK